MTTTANSVEPGQIVEDQYGNPSVAITGGSRSSDVKVLMLSGSDRGRIMTAGVYLRVIEGERAERALVNARAVWATLPAATRAAVRRAMGRGARS